MNREGWEKDLADLKLLEGIYSFKFEDLIGFIKQLLEKKEGELIERLIEEVKSMPLCYDDGYTSNESDESFLSGESHFKEHVLNLLKEEKDK